MITAAQVRNLFDYDPATGFLRWKERRGGVREGSVAGSPNSCGYIKIGISGKYYQSHRLIWLHVHGRWPVADMDHINGIKTDNRLVNLREATRSENRCNSRQRSDNTSGFKGVVYIPRLRKWRADIMLNGSSRYLGHHQTPEAAHAAYVEAAKKLHGEYARVA